MKYILFILCVLVSSTDVFCQNYMRGQVSTSRGQRLPYVRISNKNGRLLCKTNAFGNFGFTTTLQQDTLIFSCDGYDTTSIIATADTYSRVVLTPLPSSIIFTRNNSSVIIQENAYQVSTIKNESYASGGDYLFQQTAVAPGIAFSANINRASYSTVRRLINEMDGLLPPQAVRIEEMLNYFNFRYTAPQKDSVFNFTSVITECPWEEQDRLLFMNISAKKVNADFLPPGNLVFLLDVSGSMDMPNKLPLIKSGLIKMVKNLRAADTISIVTFGESVQVVLEGIAGSEKEKIITAIGRMTPDGNTPGEAGIKLAFQVARRRYIKNGNNRVILAADGDFNVGMSTEKDLMLLIQQEKQSGIYLSCLGVGSGNYKDSKLYAMAQKSNGNFAYIDNEQEAERVLVTDITRTLFTVAENVFIAVHFDPGKIKNYRLLGYENDNSIISDTARNLKGGEIGSGHSLMAVFEIRPADTVTPGNIAGVELHYSLPQQQKEYRNIYTCGSNIIALNDADSSIRQATAVVMFGMKLKDNEFSTKINWRKLQKIANSSFNTNNYLEKEFLSLISKAKKMYTHRKKYGG